MTRLIVILVALTFAVPASAGPKEEAFSVIEQFKKAYDAADPPSIVKLFATESVFLGTSMPKPTRDKDGILKYFQASASANQPRKVEIENYEALQLSETAVRGRELQRRAKLLSPWNCSRQMPPRFQISANISRCHA